MDVNELQHVARIEALIEENQKLKAELAMLRQPSRFELPINNTEELICIEQIDLLKQKSSQRELSLDEVKRLDLLVKNLRLIREQSTEVIKTADWRNLSEAELLSIATTSSE